MKIGIQFWIASVGRTPRSEPNQPSWKTRTTTP